MDHVAKVMERHGDSPKDCRNIIISHNHQDHVQNLMEVQRLFSNARTICHEADLREIQHPYIFPNSWKQGLYYYGLSRTATRFYSMFYFGFSHIYFRTLQRTNRIDATVNKETTIKLGSDRLTLITTPGHTKGHLTLLDSRKNLYLADFVPFTPWVDPHPDGLDDMIASVEKIMRLSSTRVRRTIRSHGDMRRPESRDWEVSPWAEEKDRFQFFLDTIHETVDRIPRLIRGKTLTVPELTGLIIPHFRNYSKLMARIFMPPAVSWGIAYVLHLQKHNRVSMVKKGKKILFTA